MLCLILRMYVYLAMIVKMFFVVRYFLHSGDINLFLGELVAWTIILVSPICDYLIERKIK